MATQTEQQADVGTGTSNGNGVKSPELPAQTTATVIGGDEASHNLSEQRPRKLSFDDTDMELTRLKLGAAVRRFPVSKLGIISTLFVTASLLVRYLLPFKNYSESYKIALARLAEWRQLAAERASITLAASHEHLESLRTTVAGSDLVEQLRNPSLVLFASMLGLGVTWFTYYVVYLDSSIPGVNPPTPFSASKKKRFSDKERRFHLGYITALLSGLTVFLIVLFVD